MPFSELSSLVSFLVSNTFLLVGNTIYRQTVGIPMGTNCAPVLANLFLFFYENAYISRIQIERGLEVARSFHTTFRLIDDVLSVDNPHMAEAVSKPYEEGGMYPSALQLESTTVTNTAADFVGIHIEAKKHRFRLSVYDKRDTFPFFVRRYPQMSSLIPKNIPYGVFVGLLHRGYRICSDVEDFLSDALVKARTLLTNGCKRNLLKRRFKQFVHQHVQKYTRAKGIWIMKQFCKKLGSK